MSDTLKAWCHWKKLENDVTQDELDLVKDIEDVISQVGTWKAKFEAERVDHCAAAVRITTMKDRLRNIISGGSDE